MFSGRATDNSIGEAVRTKFLAALFRLADALDVDRSRFSLAEYDVYRFLTDFTAESRLHWMKSFVVSSISINESNHVLEIQVDMPTLWEDRQFHLIEEMVEEKKRSQRYRR